MKNRYRTVAAAGALLLCIGTYMNLHAHDTVCPPGYGCQYSGSWLDSWSGTQETAIRQNGMLIAATGALLIVIASGVWLLRAPDAEAQDQAAAALPSGWEARPLKPIRGYQNPDTPQPSKDS